MLAILIPLKGQPYFEHVPNHQRGQTIQRADAPKIVSLYRAEAVVFHKQTFEWRAQFVRKDGEHVFDIWEETE